MMRAGALAFSRSSSNVVSRNGARWLTAQVSSMPSWLSCRVPYMAPALLISTSSLGQRASTSAASLRTAACDDRSATKVVDRCRLGCRADRRRRDARSRLVAADDGDVGAERGQGLRGRQADAVGGARDQDVLALHEIPQATCD